ncbi:hypothetical protein KGF36_19830, partial [Clostridioides sp. ZZV14-6009]|nr:hypothetical protein [Clostridioides sp. ZZV14-6009]
PILFPLCIMVEHHRIIVRKCPRHHMMHDTDEAQVTCLLVCKTNLSVLSLILKHIGALWKPAWRVSSKFPGNGREICAGMLSKLS